MGNSNYKKLQLLGEGATAQVYLVEERTTGMKYAMKIGGQGELLKWEAQLLQSLRSNCFPTLKEYVRENREYLVMEYIEGRSLQERLNQEDKPTALEIVRWMEGILQCLDILHTQKPGIIYRDLKPVNIMLTPQGNIRLIDFGAACYAENVVKEGALPESTKAGTYGYAAPEQFWSGVKLSKTCDIYAAGKILAYLLSGKNPAEPPYDMEQYCKGLYGIGAGYREVLSRSLAMEPQARYEDCQSMLAAIRMAYDENCRKKGFVFRKKREYTYKKCIWKSEYRRIF